MRWAKPIELFAYIIECYLPVFLREYQDGSPSSWRELRPTAADESVRFILRLEFFSLPISQGLQTHGLRPKRHVISKSSAPNRE